MKTSHDKVITMSTKPIPQSEQDIPDEVDFSRAERGKFFRPNAQVNLPIYIDGALHAQLSAIAGEQGLDVSTYANGLLKQDIEALIPKK
jgi:hypothetical protein